MKSLSKFTLLAATLLVASAGAWAHGHARIGVYWGPIWGPWWGPPVYYNPPLVVEQPVYVDPPPVIQAGPTENYWYFCRPANAYYPYVKECPSGWERVLAKPAGQ